MTTLNETRPLPAGLQSRRVDYLRLSITDRCNLRCTYCMPPEGVPPRSHADILSYEELAAFTRVAVESGITKVRITGGEPLVRKGCPAFVAMLDAIPGVSDIALTSNGLLLAQHAQELRSAGLRRVNLSIDSLRPGRFAAITRGGRVDEALAGLEAAFAVGFSPVKLNTVLLEGIEDELDDFIALTIDRPVHVRFIEYMPVDRRCGGEPLLVPAGFVLERLRERYGLAPVSGPYGHGPARYWRVPGAAGTVGFIAGVSDHFCAGCNRLRLTADGRLRTCLFSGEEADIRPLLGRPDELRAALDAVLAAKVYDRCAEQRPNDRAMSQIGG
jgi:cyclic pyranopterin phosphate synthase